ncbi:DUF3099 domain-containing protein [Homoserinimonas hongtaonis]|uniref:DUF3099 domain-containing protein n=1 Tax=Homoserinimonas hongtaonis TaxID=2079791 RepID=A0A2U1SYI3_9MICO|nr:DUF3099 domain-containing protein [Salinibacterium hongtaonis]AWB89218.1 DUF3099 domain-containing protein [Salinibacterium hongtaonis]PWB96666.1 DUF3099 domain-containing protein [Salinibacterium hongtaonis]
MAKSQPITSLPRSPDDDRRARMVKYSVTMGIRLVCIIACFFAPGWWLILPATGAIVLPYVAVIIANVSSSRGGNVAAPPPSQIVRFTTRDEDR